MDENYNYESDEPEPLIKEDEVDDLINEMVSLLSDHYHPHEDNVYNKGQEILTIDEKSISSLSDSLSLTPSSTSDDTISQKEIQTTQPTTQNLDTTDTTVKVKTHQKTRKRPRNDTTEQMYNPLPKKQKTIKDIDTVSESVSSISFSNNTKHTKDEEKDNKIHTKYELIPCTKNEEKDKEVISNNNVQETKVESTQKTDTKIDDKPIKTNKESNIISFQNCIADTKPSQRVLDLFKMDTNGSCKQEQSNVFTDNKNEILYTLPQECKEQKNANNEVQSLIETVESEIDIAIPILKAPLEFSEHYYWT